MRLYVDQMFSVDFAARLRADGHDALRTEETGQARADDRAILDFACRQQRTLLTLDGHFGDWTVLPLSRHPGVIRLRIHPPSTDSLLDVVLPFLRAHLQHEFRDHLIILSSRGERWVRTAAD